jgi:hypothetical protein
MFGFNAHQKSPPAERIADILLRTETAEQGRSCELPLNRDRPESFVP